MLANIYAFLKIFGELAAALLAFIQFLKEQADLRKQAKIQGWEEDMSQVTKSIKEAKDDEARKELVKRLADLSRNLPG